MTEVLVTLAVLGVLLMVGLPGLQDFIEDGEVNRGADDIFVTLLSARSEAVTRNAMVSICKIDPTAPTVCDNGETWDSGFCIPSEHMGPISLNF